MFSTAIRVFGFWVVTLGLVYPLLVTALSMPYAHPGVLAVNATAEGNFLARPSACDYKPDGGCATQLGPTSQALKDKMAERRLALTGSAAGVEDVPVLLQTASGSGLDPDLSPEAALFQVPRVARQRNLSEALVADLVRRQIRPPQLGFLGMPRVNVADLNRELASFPPARSPAGVDMLK